MIYRFFFKSANLLLHKRNPIQTCRCNQDQMGIFTRSKTNTTAQMIFERFKGEIPSDIVAHTNNLRINIGSKEELLYRRLLFSVSLF